jgi:hypothetical protein
VSRAAVNAAATADALLAWLGTQARSDAAVAPAESDGHPEGVATAQAGADGNDVLDDVLTPDVPITAPAAGESTTAARPAQYAEVCHRAASMRLAHTDWLHHRLAIIGAADQLAAFRRAAAGAGIIPWQLDLDRMEEDVFHLLAAPLSQPRTLSVAGARVLAEQIREAVGRRHERAVARMGASQACPFDLHALLPVPDEMLRLGPDDPVAIAWLWEHWGTTQTLRHAAEDIVVRQEARRRTMGVADQAAIHVTFWSADWTPWRALEVLAARWPELCFDIRPTYGES